MFRQPKPDSSYASNRITRRNGPKESLLSSFKGSNKNAKKDEAPPKPEPATDDEPISSSDEDTKPDPESESEDEVTPRGSGEKLEDKMAKISPKSDRKLPSPRSVKAPAKSKFGGATRKRASTGSAIQSKDDADDDLFPMWASSQPSKRRKVAGYISKGSWQSDNHIRAPGPSQASTKSETPRESARTTKSKAKQKAVTTSAKKEKAQKHEFKVPKGVDMDSPSPSSTTRSRPEFKAPPFPPDGISSSSFATSSAREPPTLDFDDDDSPLSTPLSSASSTLMQQFADLDDEMLAVKDELEESEPKEGFFCPMCKQAVDPELLIRFQAQPRQRIRDQQRFCESHKQQSAETEWQQKGYPSIDWDKFDDRIAGHFDYIDTLLVSESPSYFRNILDTVLKSGKAKNFKLTLSGDGLETISCGYYGTRGADIMLHALTTRFSRKLRRLAASDPIVKTAGVVGYTQAVLVPELAVQLVKEDLNVNDESARQILRESINLGEKFNFARDDKVLVPDEDGEEQATDAAE
ncbi:hypothetical protein P170DRAFT_461093 [Aspergillus steynii IBT 23096]|uniref:Restriction of telomere capping protein 4 n=1 Tax=Aspergillus steynii IBT 23096 TaxID=1392250 RepID=A0A2I2GQL6_9EURO|nr:uncharacterized protein P170DRAFT_461093 [Aspergillus steynii IBT 23096]PLB55163.1 hypothetical protein P170DRAFT_461093 [Aspergillus steynii IBT 23096]